MIHDRFFIGIGAQKAGTTWLHRQLYTHPQIWTPPLKELRFFDNFSHPERCREYLSGRMRNNRRRVWLARLKLRRSGDDRWRIELYDWMKAAERRTGGREGAAFYEALFADRRPSDYRAFGEISPSYSRMNRAGFQRMRDLLPHARLLLILRDPVRRCWSMAKKQAMDRHHRPELLEDAAYLRRYVTDSRHLRASQYDRTIRALDSVFAPEQVMYAYYEDIFASPESAAAFLERLCGFIGIEYDPAYFPRLTDVIWSSPARDLHPMAIETLSPLYGPVREFLESRLGHVPESWGSWASPASASDGVALQSGSP